MRRHIIKVLFFVILALFLFPVSVFADSTATMLVGFDVGGGHESIDADLAQIGGGVYANFAVPLDTARITTDAEAGYTNIRILRYRRKCPTMVMSGCRTSIDQLKAWVAQNPGQTFELGNEPGNPGQDSRLGLTDWVNAVDDAIKASDPTAFVMGPGVLNWSAGTQTIYNKIHVDAVAFHVYPTNLCVMSPDWETQMKATIDGATSYATKHGLPVWMTETSDDPGCNSYGPPRQAGVKKEHDYLASHGVRGAIWFSEGFLGGYTTGYLFDLGNNPTWEAKGWTNY